MAGFTHCGACGCKLGRVTLFCPHCGRPYCSFGCRSAHQARDCAGPRLPTPAQPRAGTPAARTEMRAR